MPLTKQAARPLAYSYVRFSTARQELGDSLRRQVEMAEIYCKENNLDLQPLSFRDLGVSAFKRKNIESGALASFIGAVKAGTISRGSYLVIEQFDRLSRADVDIALMLLLQLVNAGITVVTIADKKVWNKSTVKDLTNLIVAILYMSKANFESADKAARLEKAWDQKKKAAAEHGRILTRECPCWLEVDPDKTAFRVREDRVESIQKVFSMRNSGHGIVSIVNRANTERWPVPGKKTTWHTSLVGRLLKNRALLGEYQPHKNAASASIAERYGLLETSHAAASGNDKRVPFGEAVKGYYPAVIDDAVFHGAEAKRLREGRFPGRRDTNHRNFLRGLLRCTCGQSFVRKNKQSTKQPGYARYYCSARHRGVTDCPSVGAAELESTILHAIVHTVPQHFDGSERTAQLKEKMDLLEVNLAEARQRLSRYVEAIGETDSPMSVLMPHLKDAQSKVDQIEGAARALRSEMSELGGDNLKIFTTITRAVHNLEKGDVSNDGRAELRENLYRVMEKCVVDARAKSIVVHIRGLEKPILASMEGPTAILNKTMSDAIAGMSNTLYERFITALDSNI